MPDLLPIPPTPPPPPAPPPRVLPGPQQIDYMNQLAQALPDPAVPPGRAEAPT